MAKFNGSKAMYLRNLDPESIIFTMFTPEEIKKICTVKIISSLTFDSLGQPLSGGLYDRLMGPLSEKTLPCKTCSKNVFNCPGHFGYIELPLPVVNPLFHNVLFTILRLTCFSCHRIQITTHIKRLIPVYMKLLDAGMVTEAKDVEIFMNEIIADTSVNLSEEKSKRIRRLERKVRSIGNTGKNVLNKTTESLRNKTIHDMLKGLNAKKCMHCKVPIPKLSFFKRKIMTNVRKSEMTKDQLLSMTKAHDVKIMNPEESRKHLREIWENDRELLMELVPVLKRVEITFPTDIFYFEVIPVPPPICRPVNFVNNQIVEHCQTSVYKAVLQDSQVLRTIIHILQGKAKEKLSSENQAVYELAQGTSPHEKLHFMWQQLQGDVDCIMDREMSTTNIESQGLKQIIEKKAGIIRMHMMGKRVNFAARSVITPDPNLNIDEIGVPEAFAKHLTYPVPVTSWNVEELRKMVLNGPDVHPGAKLVEFADGKTFKISNNKTQQESILKRLLTPVDDGNIGHRGVTTVYRHLINGDILLLNRQPTLHRPSIMAHTARILKNEKTIRLHYANCKAYNADFDGDEMNMHFPQSELARSEGYNLVNVSNQYLVPKDGTPLSGLIQDHMIAGVRLSVRGRFFKYYDYQQLVFQALGHKVGNIVLLPPAILKPVMLWSGKQILSTVIINTIPRNSEPLNLVATSKIPVKAWQLKPPREWWAGGSPFTRSNDMSENEVIIRQGQLLSGVLDKQHYGATPYGLIHCMYELYGGQHATKLLSSFAKLFTGYLQQQGFTLGVRDILVMHSADKKRSKIIKECRKIGRTASAHAVDLEPDVPDDVLFEKLEIASAKNPKFRSIIDRQYKQALDSYTNDINKVCLPAGLICKFPHNNLQLMVQSGAKGSTVNTMQISCLLGQIELEGKRPPVMISGKSLPSFVPFDPQPRAGGFIDGRFMTGILPQEFFFHCMAGREGLIDTAVKTSRSGYLQRCLVKHLEGLKVEYDLTVRDSDRSVIQFLYGEDGMDISKVQFLKKSQLDFLAENNKAIVNKTLIENLKQVDDYAKMQKRAKRIRHWRAEHGDPLQKRRQSPFLKFSEIIRNKLDFENPMQIDPDTGRSEATIQICRLWQKSSQEIKDSFRSEFKPCPNPTNTDFQPDHYYGSLTDHMESLLELFKKSSKRVHSDNNDDDGDKLSDSLKLKAMQSLAAPGEPVGLLAAQSIGEPSTQMTLNTFHFAGRGEMNVTLGIPRLREILMLASANIKTPSMEIPFKNIPDLHEHAENLRRGFTRVTVANVLEKIDVSVSLKLQPIRQHCYVLRFHFLPQTLYQNEFNVTPKQVLKHMTRKFFGTMFTAIRKLARTAAGATLILEQLEKKQDQRKRTGDDDENGGGEEETAVGNRGDEDSSEEEPEDAEEDAKLSSKFRAKTETQEPLDEEDIQANKSDNDDDDDEYTEDNNEAANQQFDNSRADLNRNDLNEDEGTDEMFLKTSSFAQNYIYDKKRHLWCELTFSLPLNLKNMDLTAVLKDVADKSIISQVENVKRAITYEKDGGSKELMLRTDGINMGEMFKYVDILDVNRLYSNDIHKIAATYGIEAARRVIVKEVKDVFNVYGITVDPRHLLLIADYMTFNGTFEPLNRGGMESNASPLQQMSFEASLKFLKDASIGGKADSLTSPSSCLMLGKPCITGTGSFSLLQKIPTGFN